MKTAVVGGGINGVMIAWELAKAGYDVEVFERGRVMRATSAKSSKLLHGGLRYLEHGQWRLVREALGERRWWIEQAPHCAKPLRLIFPLYSGDSRGRLKIWLGLQLYDFLARGSGFPRSRWLSREETLALLPGLRDAGLRGAFEYWDAQMDDLALGLWAVDQARQAGVQFHENVAVSTITTDGRLHTPTSARQFERIINACGPWAGELLAQSGVDSDYQLDLVRGTHLLLDGQPAAGCVLQVPEDDRIVFVLPYQGKLLLGTTELRQERPEPCEPSADEVGYLLNVYNTYFDGKKRAGDVMSAFAGVRPIVRKGGNFSTASRESVIEQRGALTNVFGGKWTTARALATQVRKHLT